MSEQLTLGSTTTRYRCPCGCVHTLTIPAELAHWTTHWTRCPGTGEPIRIEVTP